eukprot:CAMPEP_0177250474 /NCGR_PEP_ID=MMETSP0367-20130122/53365_1 /TAXON_ID=447022 ORGANISM="Scrippsiella hangoei-like, Strain SHHI-4" /NCGR_SAMPLE_ID=MMETSP0367 /ASSEMBLY_ACC=CAM_ASM_000362 /LENGTH=61 /DNA_ID=CAMNT_0018703169 /DNA_START=494 /DNA_END=679 /DNA_ORIENTATION=-
MCEALLSDLKTFAPMKSNVPDLLLGPPWGGSTSSPRRRDDVVSVAPACFNDMATRLCSGSM